MCAQSLLTVSPAADVGNEEPQVDQYLSTLHNLIFTLNTNVNNGYNRYWPADLLEGASSLLKAPEGKYKGRYSQQFSGLYYAQAFWAYFLQTEGTVQPHKLITTVQREHH